MTTVLVPLGHDDSESLRPAVAEVLTIARGPGEVVACATAPVRDGLTGQLGNYGVSRLVLADAPEPAGGAQAGGLAAGGRHQGREVVACATAPVSDGLTEQPGNNGVSRLVLAEAPDPAGVTQAGALAAAGRQQGCEVVLLPSSFTTKEIAAHTAHQLQAGLLIDV